MSNLKKILALVLALVMSLSLVTVASAYKDDADVTDTYDEAITVLTALGVFEGENGNFYPQRNITRAETAAILYRIVTGDVNDTQDHIYADYGKFSDVNKNMWYAGYIGYCANAELIKGYGGNKFGPQDNVTGYQVLAMILRAIGYGQNGEFQGTGWEIRTASQAKKLGILDNITESTLGKAATREMVAEMLYQGLLVTQVDYTTAFGYSTYGNNTIGFDTFGLVSATKDVDNVWGQPAKTWYYKADKDNINTAKKTYLVDIPYDAVAYYTTAQTECQVASDYGFSGSKAFTTYTNGRVNGGRATLQATDTVGTIGAQGRQTYVYADRIVYIDTMLAQVDSVTAAKYDAAGHLSKYATLTLHVYTQDNVYDPVVLYSSTDYSYAVGEMLLVNAVMNSANTAVATTRTSVNGSSVDVPDYLTIVQTAQSFVGAQTTIWVNSKQHVVNGTTYDDAVRFHLDEANNETVNHTWFLDQFGNMIGVTNIQNVYSYAVLKDLYWNTGRPGYATATLLYVDGSEKEVTVKAIAGAEDDDDNVFNGTWNAALYIPRATDGNASTVKFDGDYAYVSDESLFNGMYNGYALYKVGEDANGVVTLSATNYLSDAQAQIVKGATTITTTDNLAARVYVDNATRFILKSGNTYNTYVGKDNVPTLTTTSDALFYVDANNDRVADYVYVAHGTIDGQNKALVVAMNNQYSLNLYEGQQVYVLGSAQVNGAAAANTVMSDVQNNITTMTGNTKKMYGVVYGSDGLVDSVTEVVNYNSSTNVDGYKIGNTSAFRLWTGAGELTYTAGTGTLTSAYKVGNISSWNTTNVPVYGDYSDLAGIDFTNTWVYIVVDTATKGNLSAIYVYDKAEGADGGVIAPENGTVKYVLTVKAKYTGEVLSVHTSTWSGAAGTYTGQDFASNAMAKWGLTASDYTVLQDNASVTVGAGETVTLNYVVVMK